MDDVVESSGAAPVSAGRVLREAREAQGLRLEMLAHTLKVPPHKLTALEADRYDELPDTAFTRGLAQAVCRSLKIDAAPVLGLLPRASGHRLEQIGEGLNAPFRERPGRLDPDDAGIFARPAVWGPALLLLAALVMYWLPPGLLSRLQEQAAEVAQGAPAVPLPAGDLPRIARSAGAMAEPPPADAGTVTAPAEAAAVTPSKPAADLSTGSAEPTVPVSADPVNAVAVTAAAASAVVAAPGSLLQVQASKTSWVEVIDARGRPLLSRLVKPGETVALDGDVPLKVRIGNAADTQLVFRGQPFALAPYTRDNLAKLELK